MCAADFVLYEEEFKHLEEALRRLRQEANARAVFLGKHQGMGAGLQARLGAVLGPLAGFRFGELKHTIGAQKIDGTQE